jgi:DsbC/DsbD-like thiol-disulfide interchange protein
MIFSICVLPALAQQSNWLPKDKGLGLSGAPDGTRQRVQLLSSTEANVPANRESGIVLQFLIESGLHINSHTPHTAFLVPTTLALDAPAGVRIAAVDFPPGTDRHFSFAPKEALSVYTGEVPVTARLKAAAGTYAVTGRLRYQSCDNARCNPPRTLPFVLHLVAR